MLRDNFYSFPATVQQRTGAYTDQSFSVPFTFQGSTAESRLFGRLWWWQRDNMWLFTTRRDRYIEVLLQIATLSDFTPAQAAAFNRSYLASAPIAVRSTALHAALLRMVQGMESQGLNLHSPLGSLQNHPAFTVDNMADVVSTLAEFATLPLPPDATHPALAMFADPRTALDDWPKVKSWLGTFGTVAQGIQTGAAIYGVSTQGYNTLVKSVLAAVMANEAARERLEHMKEALMSDAGLRNDQALQDALEAAKEALSANTSKIIVDAAWQNLARDAPAMLQGVQTVAETIWQIRYGQEMPGLINVIRTTVTRLNLNPAIIGRWQIALWGLQREIAVILAIQRQYESVELAAAAATVGRGLCNRADDDAFLRLPAAYAFLLSASLTVEAFTFDDFMIQFFDFALSGGNLEFSRQVWRELKADFEAGALREWQLNAQPSARPVLSNPRVSPLVGSQQETYVFRVEYYDLDGTAPTRAELYLDSEVRPLTLENAETGTYRTSLTGLSAAVHQFRFEFENGVDPVQQTALIDGPTVLAAASGANRLTVAVAPNPVREDLCTVITATLIDGAGTPVQGELLTFSTAYRGVLHGYPPAGCSGASYEAGASGTTDLQGQVRKYFMPDVPGSAVVTITSSSGISRDALVTVSAIEGQVSGSVFVRQVASDRSRVEAVLARGGVPLAYESVELITSAGQFCEGSACHGDTFFDRTNGRGSVGRDNPLDVIHPDCSRPTVITLRYPAGSFETSTTFRCGSQQPVARVPLYQAATLNAGPAVNTLSWSADGSRLAAGTYGDDTVRGWNASDWSLAFSRGDLRHHAISSAVSPDGMSFAIGEDGGGIEVFDFSGTRTGGPWNSSSDVTGLDWVGNQLTALVQDIAPTLDDGVFAVSSTGLYSLIRLFPDATYRGQRSTLKYSRASGKFAYAMRSRAGDSSVYIHTGSAVQQQTLFTNGTAIEDVAWSPDGGTIAVAGQYTGLFTIAAASPSLQMNQVADNVQFGRVAYLGSTGLLAAGTLSTGELKLFDATGVVSWSTALPGNVTSLAWHDATQRLAVGLSNGQILVYGVDTAAPALGDIRVEPETYTRGSTFTMRLAITDELSGIDVSASHFVVRSAEEEILASVPLAPVAPGLYEANWSSAGVVGDVFALGVIVTDSAGNVTEATRVRVVDFAAPLLPSPVLLSVLAESPSTAVVNWSDRSIGEERFDIQTSSDGELWTTGGSVAADVVTHTLHGLAPAGAYFIRVGAAAGDAVAWSNVLSVQTPAIGQDALGPLLVVTSHQDGQTVSTNQVTLLGTASDAGRGDAGVTAVRIGADEAVQGAVTGQAVANWGGIVRLEPGANYLSLLAVDGLGNWTASSLRLRYEPADAIPPTLVVVAPAGGGTVSVTSTPLRLAGTATDDVGVAQVSCRNMTTGASVTSVDSNNWSCDVPLVVGSNDVVVAASDVAGNAAHVSRTVAYIEPTGPSGAFQKSQPGNGAVGVPTSATLTWGLSYGATSYEYCYALSTVACTNWAPTVGGATTVTLPGVAGGTTYVWQVRARNASATVTHADGSATALWSFTTAPAAETRTISLSGDLSFGSVAVGTTGTRTFTIANGGNSPLAITSISYPPGYSGSWGSGTVAPGGSQSVTVTFAPTAATPYNGIVTVQANQTSGTPTAPITGTGVAAPTRIIGVSGNLAFGSVPVGTSATRTLAITNSGSSPLDVTSISYPPGYAGNWHDGTVAPGGSQPVVVTFAPTAAASYNGTVTVEANQTGGTPTAPISGTGVATFTRIIGLSGDLAFGSVSVGTSATRTLTIANSGTDTLFVSGLILPTGFNTNWPSGYIAPGGTASVPITFTPTTAGSFAGTLRAVGTQTGGVDAIPVSGTGTPRTTGIIEGQVRNAVTDLPQRDVRVWALTAGTWSVAGIADTTIFGGYAISGLAPGSYVLFTTNNLGLVDEVYDNIACPVTPCDVERGTPVVVTAGTTTAGRNFLLDPGGRVSGRVTDSATGAPLAGVSVSMYVAHPDGPRFVRGATSNASGDYTVTGLAAGQYVAFTSNDSGYANEIFDNLLCPGACDPVVAASSGMPIGVSLNATTAGRNFALDRAGAVSGVVTDAVSGAPIAGVGVSAVTRLGSRAVVAGAGSTDGAGQFAIRGLPGGSYEAYTDGSNGYVARIFGGPACVGSCRDVIQTTAGAAVSVTAGSTTGGVSVSLERGGRISGAVTDAASGQPLPNVEVEVLALVDGRLSQVDSVQSNASGVYETSRGLATGSYVAAAFNNTGYMQEVYDDVHCVEGDDCLAAIPSATPIPVTVGATASGRDFALSLGGTVEGTVSDAGTGAPLTGVSVWLFRQVGSGAVRVGDSARVTDASGAYSFQGLVTGTYLAFTSNSQGYADAIFRGVSCDAACSSGLALARGTPVSVTAGNASSGISFGLTRRLVPGAPTNLQGDVSGFTVAFTWDPPSTATGGLPGSYVLEAGLSPGATFVSVPIPTPSFTAPSVPAGRYYIRVRAVNGAGTGPASDEIVLDVGSDGAAPLEPPQNAVAFMSGGRLTLTWEAPAAGGTPAGYVVEAGSAAGLSNIASLPVTGTSFSFDLVPPGYYFLRVRSRRATGTSEPSNEVMIAVGGAPSPPSAPLALRAAVSGSTVTFSWAAPVTGPTTSYRLEAGSAAGLSDIAVLNTGSAGTSISFSGVPPGRYFIRLRGVNDLGAGVPSNEVILDVP